MKGVWDGEEEEWDEEYDENVDDDDESEETATEVSTPEIPKILQVLLLLVKTSFDLIRSGRR